MGPACPSPLPFVKIVFILILLTFSIEVNEVSYKIGSVIGLGLALLILSISYSRMLRASFNHMSESVNRFLCIIDVNLAVLSACVTIHNLPIER